MTKADRADVERYIRYVADEIELRDWTFKLFSDNAPDIANAHINLTYGRKLATIRLAADFRMMSAEDQRHTIAHELVHCHLEGASNMVLNDLKQWLGTAADQVFYDGFKRQMEYGVDALASALAKKLRLIEWSKG